MCRELKKFGCARKHALAKSGHSGVKKNSNRATGAPFYQRVTKQEQERVVEGPLQGETTWSGVVDARTCALTMSGGNDGKKVKTELSELGVCGNHQMRVGRAMGGSFEGSI